MDAELCSALGLRLLEMASRRCRPGAGYDARDLVQETLLRLLRWLESAGEVPDNEITARAEAYLRGLAANWRHKDDRARRIRSIDAAELTEQVVDSGPSPSWLARQAEEKAAVEQAIQNLPPGQQEVMRLILAGLPQEEIAELLGVTPASVSTRKVRGFRRLREMLPPPPPGMTGVGRRTGGGRDK